MVATSCPGGNGPQAPRDNVHRWDLLFSVFWRAQSYEASTSGGACRPVPHAAPPSLPAAAPLPAAPSAGGILFTHGFHSAAPYCVS